MASNSSAKCIAIQLKPHQCTASDHNATTAAVNIELSMNGAMFNVSSRPFHFMAFYFGFSCLICTSEKDLNCIHIAQREKNCLM